MTYYGGPLMQAWDCACRPYTKPCLGALNVDRAKPFRSTLYFKFHFFPVPESFVPAETVYIIAVYENVSATFFRFNKTESLGHVEPLDPSFCHRYRLVVQLGAAVKVDLMKVGR